jgi:hypothetical protein
MRLFNDCHASAIINYSDYFRISMLTLHFLSLCVADSLLRCGAGRQIAVSDFARTYIRHEWHEARRPRMIGPLPRIRLRIPRLMLTRAKRRRSRAAGAAAAIARRLEFRATGHRSTVTTA